jgi:hypothetical protein
LLEAESDMRIDKRFDRWTVIAFVALAATLIENIDTRQVIKRGIGRRE